MTGKRGPISGANGAGRPGDPARQVRNGTARATSTALVRNAPVVTLQSVPPTPPESVLDVELWNTLWHAMPEGVLTPLDVTNVVRFIDMTVERERYSRIAADAPLLSKPIQNARGDNLGTEVYANPLISEMRKLDRALDSLSAQLGLSPQSRARLGWIVADAVNKEVQTESILERLARRDAYGPEEGNVIDAEVFIAED
jgi:P27 family predicted phage terminase small subunit